VPTLHFYTRPDCSLCESALSVVKRLQRRFTFKLEQINIDEDPALQARYGTVIPVLACGEMELARSFFDEKILLQALTKSGFFDPQTIFTRVVDNYKG
jgi:hypothetical protein